MLALSLMLALGSAEAAASPTAATPRAPTEQAPPGPVRVTAGAGKSEVTVGEAFTIEVRAEGPAGTTFAFAGEASAGALELRSLPQTDAAAPAPGTHRYEAVLFDLGELTIPPIPVRYTLPDGTAGEAASLPLAIRVVSLLPKDPERQTLADIRGPASVSIGRAFWLALGAGTALLAGLAFLALRRRRRAGGAGAAPEPEPAADAEALGALEALAAEALPARGQLRPFYIRLSAIAKRYLERRLAAPVLEMTSAETLGFLRGHPHGADLLPVVRDLAEAADRVKFAKGEGLVHEAERHLATVRALVHALEARLRPPASATAEQGKAA